MRRGTSTSAKVILGLLFAAMLLVPLGCDLPSTKAPVATPATSTASDTGMPTAESPSVEATSPTNSPEDTPIAVEDNAPAVDTSQPGGASNPPVPSTPAIKLSAGTALPQTLPTGTAMGFSVDYRFVSGGPDPALKYIWVIERARGEQFQIPVQLSPSDTLQTFVPWRPEEGPFRTQLVAISADGQRQAVSATVSLR